MARIEMRATVGCGGEVVDARDAAGHDSGGKTKRSTLGKLERFVLG